MIRITAEADVETSNIYVHFLGSGDEFKDYVARIKSLQTRRFDGKLKCWIIPLAMESVREFNRNFPNAELGKDLLAFMDRNTQKSELYMEIERLKLEKDIETPDYDWGSFKPFAHQKIAFEVMRRMNYGALLLEMGCGKSAVAAHLARYRMKKGEVKSVLIVAPKSVIPVWSNTKHGELVKHGVAKPDDIHVLKGSTEKRVEEIVKKRKLFTIVNYESTWRILAVLKDEGIKLDPWDMIILDESTRIKSHKAKQTKACIAIGKKAKYRNILTGTPITQGPLDWWSQAEFLEEGLLGYGNFYEYQSDFTIVRRTDIKGITRPIRIGYRNLDKLQRLVEPFSIRYLKSECLDLPEQVTIDRYVELQGDQLKAYEEVRDECLHYLESGEKVTAVNILAKLTRLHQVCSGHVRTDDKKLVYFENQAKLDLLGEVLDDIGDGPQIVIFARYVPDIKLIEKFLQDRGVAVSTFYGDTKDRDAVLTAFLEGKDRVCIAQTDTGGLGINEFVVASYAIYFSHSFRYESWEQSKARLHRPGQKNKVTYIDLITTAGTNSKGNPIKTLDSKVVESLKKKQDMADVVNGDTVKKWLKEVEGE